VSLRGGGDDRQRDGLADAGVGQPQADLRRRWHVRLPLHAARRDERRGHGPVSRGWRALLLGLGAAAALATVLAGAPSGAPRHGVAADSVVVTIEEFAFDAGRLEIAQGTTVRWVNRDAFPHTVTAADSSWSSEVIPPGRSWARTFGAVGSFAYYCVPHPFMKGVVTVRGTSADGTINASEGPRTP